MTADEKYSRHNTENSPQPIEVHLSYKRNPFVHDFIAILESKLTERSTTCL